MSERSFLCLRLAHYSILIIFFILITTLSLVGCTNSQSTQLIGNVSSTSTPSRMPPEQLCELRCQTTSQVLTNGPCLGVVAPDWVCDVVHEPREPIDDLVANQCSDYNAGRAHHFVEVGTNCSLIRKQ